MTAPTTRFAPSPTGRLHLGHAASARHGFEAARQAGGRFLLRIEEIDGTRCRREHEDGILDDLRFLGLSWDGEVRRQSEHLDDYERAVERLREMELLYPCFCTRADIAAEIARAACAPHDLPVPGPLAGPCGPLYPGTCRRMAREDAERRIASGAGYGLRLDVERSARLAEQRNGGPLFWHDRGAGRIEATPRALGDVVLARKEIPTSYHLAVSVDDHLQGVTLVTRGTDLFHATHIHRLLQALLGLDVPEYDHHPLVLDDRGERLAKRRHAPTIRSLRDEGRTAAEIWRMAGWPPVGETRSGEAETTDGHR
ncbi:MAG: tRNA glutamyl-Q(34) synthetase GluQRS [Deltaproteobacteria bacterium]|nr:tRNA glutamyl-Q(34) synthetase GluQRS [Deltaproteobacteria bacterium]